MSPNGPISGAYEIVIIEVMTIIMNDSHIVSITQLEAFIKGAEEAEITFRGKARKEKYAWIKQTLARFHYFRLTKKEKSILRKFIMQMTGYSKSQLTRLIGKKKRNGVIVVKTSGKHEFPQKYTTEDVALLIETDKAHSRLSGPATKKIFARMYEVFKNVRFSRLKDISVSHIYNLREKRQYLSQTYFFEKTKSTAVPIGERRKPDPQGQPGFIRVDTVHQGDLDKEKGVYHVNLVDEVTQWEIVVACEKVSEYFLLPVLEAALDQFPFRILGFHSDNGSEYINKIVARLLNKLLIEQTKSRARHCNDNALVEGKNGSVVRKHMGRNFISQKHAPAVNQFHEKYLNPYLNYHRPCGFAALITDKRGKQRKIYRKEDYMTPHEKLKSLPNAAQYLKEGVTFEDLDRVACAKSNNECAALMQKAKVELFQRFTRKKLSTRGGQLPTTYSYLPRREAGAILGS